MAMKTLWWNWKKSVHKINMVISFVLMGITYWTAVMPVALFFKARGTQLLDREKSSAKTFWTLKKDKISQDIRRSQRMY